MNGVELLVLSLVLLLPLLLLQLPLLSVAAACFSQQKHS
jgi:hypothetical protein